MKLQANTTWNKENFQQSAVGNWKLMLSISVFLSKNTTESQELQPSHEECFFWGTFSIVFFLVSFRKV